MKCFKESDYQLTGDSGSGAKLGDFKSQANGIGPQVGYLFKMFEKDAYLNLKGYWEFGASTVRTAGIVGYPCQYPLVEEVSEQIIVTFS